MKQTNEANNELWRHGYEKISPLHSIQFALSLSHSL